MTVTEATLTPLKTAPPTIPGWLVTLVAVAALVGYDHFWRSRPEPPYVPPLASAARHSKDSFAPDLSAIAQKIRSGSVTTKAQLVDELANHSRAFMSAVDELCQVETVTGKITNSSAVADAFDQAGKATR